MDSNDTSGFAYAEGRLHGRWVVTWPGADRFAAHRARDHETAADHEIWLADTGGRSYAQMYAIERVLHRSRSRYQLIEVLEHALFGKLLVLDGAVQVTTFDEFVYHEMLSHPLLIAHPDPKAVLVIGGGDGGLIRECARHPLETIVLVEIDQNVIDVTREHMPGLPGGVFDDSRLEVVIGDGFAYLEQTSQRFDLVLVDSTDPKGPGLSLFTPAFYSRVRDVLRPGGMVAVQSGSPLFQSDLAPWIRGNMETAFSTTRTYWATIPTYPGVLWSFTLGTLGPDPAGVGPERIRERLDALGGARYYSAAVHTMAFGKMPFDASPARETP
ncbi:MAG: polyamine aminopropyltransferase [Candidatus Eisenbacteria bacterium]|nr:polyamine aminopropyltransferase [Candidatus Eisenbacteria bacterium]